MRVSPSDNSRSGKTSLASGICEIFYWSYPALSPISSCIFLKGTSLGFFDEPTPGQQQQNGAGSRDHVQPGNGEILNLEYVEFRSFKVRVFSDVLVKMSLDLLHVLAVCCVVARGLG